MSKFADRSFWVDTADRALTSFAQGLIGSLSLDSVGIINVDWVQGGSLAASFALLSVLTSIAARGNRGETPVDVSVQEWRAPLERFEDAYADDGTGEIVDLEADGADPLDSSVEVTGYRPRRELRESD